MNGGDRLGWIGNVDRRLRQLLRTKAGAETGVVVAVSGGSDSVGLLRVLHELAPGRGVRLFVAHLDHGTRGEIGRADARFVAELAGRLGVPCDLGRWEPTRSGHFEADARNARYAWLAEVAETREACAVAVGHTRDDQAETILHRILRGTGPRGLAGMPARRPLAEGVELVRPLLQVSRAEVRAWLTTIGQDWREDATNADLARTRSRLRHDLLPRLAAEYNPKIVEALVRLGWLVRGSNRAAEAWWQEHTEAVVLAIESETIRLRREPLAALPRIVRAELLRVCWRRAGWSEQPMGAARWLRLADLILHGKCRASIGGGIDARTHGEIFQLTRARVAATSLPPEVTLPIPGEAVWGAFRLVAEIADEAKPMSLSPGSVERIDLARLDLDPSTPALRVRSPRDGDRFEPLGLDGHTTALSDFLRGRGLARERRRSVPLVCDRTGIVWVVGHRITHRVRRTPATRSVLVLRSEPVASANREGGESGE